MPTQRTATFNIDVPYTGQDGTAQVRQCVLTLSISMDDLVPSSEGEGLGEITMQGPVMPVEGVDPGSTSMGDEVTIQGEVTEAGSDDRSEALAA